MIVECRTEHIVKLYDRGQNPMTEVLTRLEYLRLAVQFDERARSSSTEKDAEEYRARAAVFRRLADARLLVSKPEGNFIRRSIKRDRKPTHD
jgi:hypothetical protein